MVTDGGSGVNVISEATGTNLGLLDLESCPFHLRMADMSAVCPLGLLPKLPIRFDREMFEILAVVLWLSEQGSYPLLLRWPSLMAATIKQDWTKDRLPFRRGSRKIRIPTTTSQRPPQALTPICGEAVNFVEGLTEEEVTAYQDANPDFFPLFEIYVLELLYSPPPLTDALTPPEDAVVVSHEAAAELALAFMAMRAERAESDRVQATALEELNLGTSNGP